MTITQGLDGVLLAFILYLMVRGISLALRLPEIVKP
jgi:hypothetical protein